MQKHRVLMHSKDSLTARAYDGDEDLRWKSGMARLIFSRPHHVCSTGIRFKAGVPCGEDKSSVLQLSRKAMLMTWTGRSSIYDYRETGKDFHKKEKKRGRGRTEN